MPYIIIVNGLPVSGKSSLHTKVIAEVGLDDSDLDIIRIDDLVENNDKYKEMIKQIVVDVCKNDDEICDKLGDELNEPSEEFQAAFQEAYDTVRGKENTDTYCGLPENPRQKCSDYHDDLLRQATQRGRNIVFETVGRGDSKWLFTSGIVPDSYDVYYAFTTIGVKPNLARHAGRVTKDMETFLKDKTKAAPRLVTHDEKHIQATCRDIESTLDSLIQRKLEGNIAETLGRGRGPGQVRILEWENSYPLGDVRNTLIYDSSNPRVGPEVLPSTYDDLCKMIGVLDGSSSKNITRVIRGQHTLAMTKHRETTSLPMETNTMYTKALERGVVYDTGHGNIRYWYRPGHAIDAKILMSHYDRTRTDPSASFPPHLGRIIQALLFGYTDMAIILYEIYRDLHGTHIDQEQLERRYNELRSEESGIIPYHDKLEEAKEWLKIRRGAIV